MWLLRGLSFTCKALQFAQANKAKELAEGFSKSYEQTLRQFHNFVVKGIFTVRAHIYIFFTVQLIIPYAIKGCNESLPLSS